MHDLDVHAAGLGDVDRLRERLEYLVRFIAQMREIAGIVAFEHVAKRDHLWRFGVGAGRGEEAGREPERAGNEGILEQRDHGVELARGRRAALHAHDHQAQRIVADQHAGIDRGRGKAVEILRERRLLERQPWRAGTEVIAQQCDLARQGRRDREAAVADDLGGDALANLALGLGIDRQREVGMGLDIDEAGRHRQALGIDHLGCRAFEIRRNGVDAATADGDVAPPAGRAGAVEQQAAADQDVVGRNASGHEQNLGFAPHARSRSAEINRPAGRNKPA